jgi:hypothetical protein
MGDSDTNTKVIRKTKFDLQCQESLSTLRVTLMLLEAYSSWMNLSKLEASSKKQELQVSFDHIKNMLSATHPSCIQC